MTVPVAIPQWLRSPAAGLLCSTLALFALTAVLAPLLHAGHLLNVALIFLLVALLAAAAWGYRVGLFAAAFADLLVNFFFVPPLHTIAVQSPGNVVALVLFLAVATVGASMLALLRRQVALAQAREAEMAVLLELNHALAAAVSPRDALDALCGVLVRALPADGCAILRADDDGWSVVASTPDAAGSAALTRAEEGVATAALRRGSIVGHGRASRRRLARRPDVMDSGVLFVPFPTAAVRGALRVTGARRRAPLGQPDRLLYAFAAEAGVSLQRFELAIDAAEAETLRRADAFKSVLLSSVSHDLRSPLTAIKAAVGNLRDPEVQWSAGDAAGFLETIESQTDRLTETVSDLLQMSRLEAGVVQTLIEPVQVLLLLRDAAQAAQGLADGRRIVVEADEALWVSADYGLIMRALGNLIENAARYSMPQGRICLAAHGTAHDRVRITVTDEGPGIPREQWPHLFEQFYRGPDARQRRGTGLGLSIAKSMVELCGGAISVHSSAGGTEFRVDVPAAAEVVP